MTRPIYVLNGPNLNRLGMRLPELYGHSTLADVERMSREAAGGRAVEFRQTNAEHQMIDWIHEAIDRGDGIVINPAGFTFNSIPVFEALKMFTGPVIELHITNVHKREPMYHNSLVSKTATAIIAGLGPDGYRTAMEAMLRLLAAKGA